MITVLESLPLDYLYCRAFGHSWEEYVATDMRKPTFGFRFSLLCTSCGTERHELIDTNKNVIQREYRYADGYQLGFCTMRSDARLVYDKRRSHQTLAHDTTVKVS